jgi:hypothetical protein
MKKTLFVVLTIALSISLLAQGKKGRESTIRGEVVDLQCYMSGATGTGKGASHKDCAISCAKGGIPLGILEDKSNTLYLAGQTKDAMKGANEMLLPFVAEKVTVTGRIYEKGGIKLLMIKKISKQSEK